MLEVISCELSACNTALLSEKILTYLGFRLFLLLRYLTASVMAIASAWKTVAVLIRGIKSSCSMELKLYITNPAPTPDFVLLPSV